MNYKPQHNKILQQFACHPVLIKSFNTSERAYLPKVTASDAEICHKVGRVVFHTLRPPFQHARLQTTTFLYSHKKFYSFSSLHL